MAGFLCIAMMKSSPYVITVGVTEYEPDIWAESLLLPAHLLYYEGFSEPKAIENKYLQRLQMEGIAAESGKAFFTTPDVAIKTFVTVRDEVNRINAALDYTEHKTEETYDDTDTDTDDIKTEGEKLYYEAKKSPFASEKAFHLYEQAAKQGHQPAYIALAHAYLNGWGVKRNVNTALKSLYKLPNSFNSLNTDERTEVGELLHNLAAEYENGSDQVIPDFKKAYQLNLQSAELGCDLAYTSLACGYLTGNGVEKNLNAALEWSIHEIEANIIYGYNHATSCFVEAGMKEQAEQLWKRCFKEQPIETIATSCLRVYKKQVLEGGISIDPDIEILFGSLAERLSHYQKELSVSIYDDEIAWLNIHDTCIVCHIPILPETARKTEGKCTNCFINGLS